MVITDALKSPTCHVETSAGELATEAGAEILLYTDSAAGELRAPYRIPARPQRAQAQIVFDAAPNWLARVARRPEATTAAMVAGISPGGYAV